MDVLHSWDAAGNLVTRQDVLTSETESFAYDFLDRLTSVSGAYSNSFAYDEIGNMLSKNGVSYSYDSTQPHAVDSVGGLPYTYDSNGNMTYRGSDNQTITWDVENRPVTVSENGSVIATFIYDGDGNRIKKTEAGETVLYINRFYEKNITTGNVTTSYYLGSRLVAQREGETLRYIHQDNLSGTSLVTSDNGTMISSIKYFPFGETKSGDAPTDVKFTGQRLDGTGLYYYGARYYDPLIGRLISADTIIPNPADPQAFNRYTYCLNNPLKYVDPSGHEIVFTDSEIENVDNYLVNGQYCQLLGVAFRIQLLQQIWDSISSAAPEAAAMLASEDTPLTEIRWDDNMLDTHWGQTTTDKEEKTNPDAYQVIRINTDLMQNTAHSTAVFGEEIFHSLLNLERVSKRVSKDEEAIAKSFGFWVSAETGNPYWGFVPYGHITPNVSNFGKFSSAVNRGVGELSVAYSELPRAGEKHSFSIEELWEAADRYWPHKW